jgi:2-methylisocitrate lyase-like PEP mutase family enzyme
MTDTLKERLSRQGPALMAPGAYDALSALLIEQAGFEAVYISGASVAYTQLGRPDIGLVSMDQLADVVARVRDRVRLPLIVDADTGFGNALNVFRTVSILERAGANAVQLEDQSFPKRCGHLPGKRLIPAAEMVGKVNAALDARASDQTLIVARTDAIAVEGLSAALDRAEMYLETGADVIFVEAPRQVDHMRAIAERLSQRTALIANMVEGGQTPSLKADELSDLGFRLVILPGAMVRLFIPAAEALLASLRATGSTRAFMDRMTDLDGVNRRVGLQAMMAQGAVYDGPAMQLVE